MSAVMAGAGIIVKLEILAEHGEQMLFEPHHQRVDQRVEDDVGTFKAHQGRIARRKILHMDGCRDDGAGYSQPLSDMAFHLRAKNHLRRERRDRLFHREVIVGDQGFDAEFTRECPDRPRLLAVEAAKAHNIEPHLVARDAGKCCDMRPVAEEKHPLAGEIRAVNRLAPPRQAQAVVIGKLRAGNQLLHLVDKGARGANADGHGLCKWLTERLFKKARGSFAGFGIHQHIEVGSRQPGNIGRCRAKGGDNVHVDPHV